jgi:hypothetical protein
VIWAKTDAGRTEMQTRALVKERARRNLLLLIDGVKSEETLLAGLTGVGAEDFQALQKLALIAPVAATARAAGVPAAAVAAPNAAAAAAAPLDHGQFTAALTQLISSHLGLRGFVLTLAVEKAGTTEELQAVAQRTLAQIRERKGEAVAAAARRTLYGA